MIIFQDGALHGFMGVMILVGSICLVTGMGITLDETFSATISENKSVSDANMKSLFALPHEKDGGYHAEGYPGDGSTMDGRMRAEVISRLQSTGPGYSKNLPETIRTDIEDIGSIDKLIWRKDRIMEIMNVSYYNDLPYYENASYIADWKNQSRWNETIAKSDKTWLKFQHDQQILDVKRELKERKRKVGYNEKITAAVSFANDNLYFHFDFCTSWLHKNFICTSFLDYRIHQCCVVLFHCTCDCARTNCNSFEVTQLLRIKNGIMRIISSF